MTISLRPLLALLFCGLVLQAAPAGAVGVGHAAPEFDAQLEGGPLQLRAFRGQVLLLDFWASWCGPCKESFPWMNAMHERYRAQGLHVVAVNVDRKRADADRFLATSPARFRVVFDPQGRTPAAYAVQAMPSSVLIGPDGRVLKVHAGFKAEDTAGLEAAIVEALKAVRP